MESKPIRSVRDADTINRERLSKACQRLEALVEKCYDADFTKRVTITPQLGADISAICDMLYQTVLAVEEPSDELDQLLAEAPRL